MKPGRAVFATICAAALFAVDTATATQITEADLLNGVLPAPSTFSRVSGSVHGVTNGQDYHGQYLTMDNDSKSTNFNLSEAATEDGCGCDFKLSPIAGLNTYSIRVASETASHVSRAPKKWAIYGSSDQTTWTLLTTEENQTDWVFTADEDYDGSTHQHGETRLYRFPYGGSSYQYIRFRFLENNGDSSKILVTRITPYPLTVANTGATSETFAGCADLVPASTAETASRYTSTTHAATDFYVGDVTTAFSNDDPARVMMKNVADGRANLIYEFGTENKKIVNGYMVRFPNHQNSNVSRAPQAWTFYGSNDGPTDAATWTVLDARNDQVAWTKDEKRYYHVSNHTAYAYYKIEFTANNGESHSDYFYEFGNLDYYYLQPDEIVFTALDAQSSGGQLVVSGSLQLDSLPANVSFAMVTNGVQFVYDCGAVQPGGSFSASFPLLPGTYYGTLVGISGVHTNTVVAGPLYISSANTRIVSPSGNDENDGQSLETPMLHIADAVASLGASGGMVFVLPGTYTETNDLTAVELSTPVSVIGVTGNPADAIVTQGATYGYARIFKLTHESALLRGMTITGGKVQNEPKDLDETQGHTIAAANATGNPGTWVNIVNGGNILMTAGLVENCIISSGHAVRYASVGGNVWMSGGRLSRCELVKGSASRNYFDGGVEAAGSITATGGLVENCLIRNCATGYAAISAEGTSKFVNCTVVSNTTDGCAGFIIAGNDSRVINTVIFDNRNRGNTSPKPEYPNPEPSACNVFIAARYSTKVPANAAAAFVNCATDGDTAINETCIVVESTVFADSANGDYSPASESSPLVNAGADYATNGGVSLFDLVNNPRVWTKSVDIGAYEFKYKRPSGFSVLIR